MKKVQTKNKLKGFFGLFAAFALAIGVGVSLAPKDAVKTSAASYTATITKANSTAYTSAFDNNHQFVVGTGNQNIAIANNGGATITVKYNRNNTETHSVFKNSSSEFRLYPGGGNGGGLTFDIAGNYDFTKITIATSQNPTNGSTIDGAVATTRSFTGDKSQIVIKNGNSNTSGKSNQLKVTSIELEYADKGGGEPEPEFGTLSSIVIKTPATKTAYKVGQTFSSGGLVLTASDSSTPVITKEITSGYTTDYDGIVLDSSYLGTKLVTVYYTDVEDGPTKTVTYNITISEKDPGYSLASASDLQVGATYTIAAKSGFAISGLNSGAKYFNSIAVDYEDDAFPFDDDVLRLELVNGSVLGSYAFKILNTAQAGKYITYSGSSNDLYSTTKTTIDAAASWTYDDTVGIYNVGVSTRNLQYNSGSPRFAAYTTAQTKAFLFVDETTIITQPEYVSTTRIEVSSDLAKKTFFTHEAYSTAGLLLVAYDDNNGVSKLVDSGFTTSMDGKTFSSSDVADQVPVVVTYDGKSGSYAIDIKEAKTFVKVTNKFQLQVGGVYIATGVHSENGIVAMGKEEGTNRNVVAISELEGNLFENDDVQLLELHKGHENVAGSFAFESIGGAKDGQFLAATGTGTSNYMQSQETITVKGSWVINVGENTTIEATGAGFDRNKMRFNETNNIFSAYGGDGQKTITLYVDESSILAPTYYETKLFADWVMAQDSGDAQGMTNPTACEEKFLDAWVMWDELSQDAKDLLSSHVDFAAANARFLNWAIANDSLEDLDSNNPPAGKTVSNINDNSLTATIIIGVIGLTTLAGYYFLQKKKEA